MYVTMMMIKANLPLVDRMNFCSTIISQNYVMNWNDCGIEQPFLAC